MSYEYKVERKLVSESVVSTSFYQYMNHEMQVNFNLNNLNVVARRDN